MVQLSSSLKILLKCRFKVFHGNFHSIVLWIDYNLTMLYFHCMYYAFFFKDTLNFKNPLIKLQGNQIVFLGIICIVLNTFKGKTESLIEMPIF